MQNIDKTLLTHTLLKVSSRLFLQTLRALICVTLMHVTLTFLSDIFVICTFFVSLFYQFFSLCTKKALAKWKTPGWPLLCLSKETPNWQFHTQGCGRVGFGTSHQCKGELPFGWFETDDVGKS